jgi:hypothetical protein
MSVQRVAEHARSEEIGIDQQSRFNAGRSPGLVPGIPGLSGSPQMQL